MTWCERCDMEQDFCEHGLAERRAAQGTAVRSVLLSPAGLAHHPGCPHKDDDDFTRWALLDSDHVWTRLANGEPLSATSPHGQSITATGRCQTCLEHGPWA